MTVRPVDPKLLEILVCPLTRGPLRYDAARQELISDRAHLAYPIRDGFPVMLAGEARSLDGGGKADTFNNDDGNNDDGNNDDGNNDDGNNDDGNDDTPTPGDAGDDDSSKGESP